MKKAVVIIGTLLLVGMLLAPRAARSQCGESQYIASIALTANTKFAPTGWAFCEGQLLPIAQNQALFALIGNTYGGNGTTNFALPDLRDVEKTLVSVKSATRNTPRYVIATTGMFPPRP